MSEDDARVIDAIDTLLATQFHCGRVPIGADGNCVRDAYMAIKNNQHRPGTIELLVEHDVLLVAVAEAVRVGVLVAVTMPTKPVVQGGRT